MNEKNYLIIEEFLEGTISDSERVEVERRLENDPEFLKEFNLLKEMRARLGNSFQNSRQNEELHHQLEGIGEEFFTESTFNDLEENESFDKKGKSVPYVRWALRIAAGIALVLGIGYFLLSDDNDLYEKYATIPPAGFTMMSADENDIQKAEMLFNQKQYADALPILKSATVENPSNLEFKFYLGLTYLEMGRYKSAEEIFSEMNVGSNGFAQDALWFLTMTYLKAGKNQEAIEMLNRIEEESIYYDKAMKLLKEI